MNFNDYVGQGFAFFQKKEYKPAIEQFEAALQLIKPDDNQEIRNLIEGAKELERIEAQAAQAMVNEAGQRAASMGIEVENIDKAITEALKSNLNDDSVKSTISIYYYIRGLTFAAKKEYAQAIADYSEAIKYEPDYPHAFNKRGQAHLVNADFDNAVEDFKELIRLNKKYSQDNTMAEKYLADAHMKRGMAYYEKGDYARAIPDFEEFLKFAPDNSTARELLETAKAEKAKQ
jgi:tetratricopeptide (TPR) repeat protein